MGEVGRGGRIQDGLSVRDGRPSHALKGTRDLVENCNSTHYELHFKFECEVRLTSAKRYVDIPLPKVAGLDALTSGF